MQPFFAGGFRQTVNGPERNSILAIVLSFLVLLIWWSSISKRPVPPANNTDAVKAAGHGKTEVAETGSGEISDEEIGEEETLEIKNANLRCLFGRKSGQLHHLYLKENSSEVDLILPDSPLPFVLKANGNILKTPTVSEKNNSVLVSYPGTALTFSLKDSYLMVNAASRRNAPLEISWAGGIGTDPGLLKEQLKRKLQRFHINDGKVKKISSLLEKRLYGWVCLSNRYFLIAFFPDGKIPMICDPKNPEKLISFSAETGELKLKILIAQKEYAALTKRGEGLQKTLDLGLFSFLSIFFIHILSFFKSITGNYGWSICILTGIIQFFMFPLTKKNLKSAAAMKRIQPYVKKLQQQYKDDPKRMQSELMNLYKVQKVNPLGGCLPMLLQIPIFWSLFTMLQGLVELRGAPWILWLTDLSKPDALFGHFPSFVPLLGGWPIGPLPLLMGLTMFLQQRLTITDPQQKAFLLMPIFFTFIFLKFPSGLVLYWFTSNLLTFGQQLILTKK